MQESITSSQCLLVVTPIDPLAHKFNNESGVDDPGDGADSSDVKVIIPAQDKAKDQMDVYNHPRERRVLILKELMKRQQGSQQSQQQSSNPPAYIKWVVVDKNGDRHYANENTSVITSTTNEWVRVYETVHTERLLEFLSTAWTRWNALGKDGQPPGCFVEVIGSDDGDDNGHEQQQQEDSQGQQTRVLVPGNVPLHRDVLTQRPSQNVMGQMGFFCTDVDTPVFADLLDELYVDASLIQTAVRQATSNTTIYTLVTHPGHHAASDSFGGYCYVNHVAAMARLFQTRESSNNDNNTNETIKKVAILDVDYHVGNGTASIFYSDPTVLVISIHCDPDFEYPFHSGFANQTGDGNGEGATLFLPLPPGTDWKRYSRDGLAPALAAVADFGAEALLVSLGLDTHLDDPVTLRRAGFALQGNDYQEMGRQMGKSVAPLNIPTAFLQEGGYLMDHVAGAAADVLTSFCQAKSEFQSQRS